MRLAGGAGAPASLFPRGVLAEIVPAGSVIIRIHRQAHSPLWFGPQPGTPPRHRFDAPPETLPPAGPAIGIDGTGVDAPRPQLSADHITADADLLGDVGKRPALTAQRHDRRHLVVEQHHALRRLGSGELAAVRRPARVVGDIGALCHGQLGALLGTHLGALAGLGLGLRVGRRLGSCCPWCPPARCRRLASGAVARGRARRARHALRAAVARERSDTVPAEPEALRRLAKRGLRRPTPGPDRARAEARRRHRAGGHPGRRGS